MKKWKALLFLLLLVLALVVVGPSLPAQDEAAQEELETFVPSEEIPADSAISFPVDI